MFLRIGSVSAFLAVALGALGAHSLKPHLSYEQLTAFETGVRYHLVHSLAVVLVAALIYFGKKKGLVYAGWLFTAGIVLFSGSIYLLTVQDLLLLSSGFLGFLTPVGGLLFLAGWVFVFVSTFQKAQVYHHAEKREQHAEVV